MKDNIKKTWQDNWQKLVLCLPAIIKVFIFSYIPMLGIIIAFKDYKYSDGIIGSKTVWFDNFKFFFESHDAWQITRNTVLMNLLNIGVGTIVSIIFSLFLFEIKNKVLIKTYQTIFFFPYLISWVIVGYFAESLLLSTGVINNVYTSLTGNDPIRFYFESKYWPWILLITSLWKSTGYGCIMFYAVLVKIPSNYYEAAELDGATRFQKMRYISFPLLIPLITILTILNLGGIFRSDFGLFYFVPKNDSMSQLWPTADVIDTYVYRALKNSPNIGMTAAVGLYQSLVGLITIVVANYIVKKIDSDLSLF